MGGQGGIARFLGSCKQLVGYVDDGKPLWRQHNGLDKKKWKKMPSMEGQRVAARYFGAASAVAGDLWSKLPREMRRLADGGGFNRLVGKCRDLIEADGQLWNLDDLAGLDLSADSSGPLVVSGGVSEGWRLSGVRELMRGIDQAVGPGAGQRSEKYIVANRFVNDGIVRNTVDWGKLGDCRKWRGKFKNAGPRAVRFETQEVARRTKRRTWTTEKQVAVQKPLPPNLKYAHWTGPQRRLRVWVYASEVGSTAIDPRTGRFELDLSAYRRGCGLVTDWLVGSRFVDIEAGIAGWAADYAVSGSLELPPYDPRGTGIFVVFTAIEVAEKRGRHWVRLPWCSRMQVHSVVDNWYIPAPKGYNEGAWPMSTGRLVAAPARRMEGMDMNWLGAWDFWARWDGWDGWMECPHLELAPTKELVIGYDRVDWMDPKHVAFGRDGP